MKPITKEQLLQNGIDTYDIVDVRSEKDFAKRALPGARNIPFEQIVSKLSVLREEDEKPIVFYCNAGGKSKRAAKLLSQNGNENIFYLEGGITKW